MNTLEESKIQEIEKQLEEYRAYLEILADENKSEIFYNSSKEHAAEVMGLIFNKSKKKVLVNAGDLNGAVCNSPVYYNGLLNFLYNGGEVEFLVKEFNPKSRPPFFDKLFNFINSNLKLKVSQRKKEFYLGNGKVAHFCVGDGKMYRLENDTNKYLAFGSFNDVTTSQNLIQIFDTLSKDSEEIKQN